MKFHECRFLSEEKILGTGEGAMVLYGADGMSQGEGAHLINPI